MIRALERALRDSIARDALGVRGQKTAAGGGTKGLNTAAGGGTKGQVYHGRLSKS